MFILRFSGDPYFLWTKALFLQSLKMRKQLNSGGQLICKTNNKRTVWRDIINQDSVKHL